MKKIIIYLLCLVMVLALPGATMIEAETDYTVLIPEDPTSLIIYYHCGKVLFHSNGRESKTLYNF